ncbi:GNAT family N-acetyltransferase [Micromonospora noduli]|uniref:GNAT family N-acetyltransferase n=1 Tax=Micromonospora noduli TaxID=709876 RepID=UPI00341461FC
MPLLVAPALPAGSLAAQEQPHLPVRPGLALRPWRDDDAPAVRAAFDCPVIQRWHVRRLDSDDEALSWTAQWAGRWRDESAASWAVVAADDRPVGQVGLRDVLLTEASAQVSYWVVPTARGRGVATEALLALTRWSFTRGGFHRLALEHSTGNEASCRVAGRAGFTEEGVARLSVRHADGWHDMHRHARLATSMESGADRDAGGRSVGVGDPDLGGGRGQQRRRTAGVRPLAVADPVAQYRPLGGDWWTANCQ